MANEIHFYHGTTDAFQMRLILPPTTTGFCRESRDGWRTKHTDCVFLTNSVCSAENYAKKAAGKFGGNPVVYEVLPIGKLEHIQNTEFVAEMAKIIRRV